MIEIVAEDQGDSPRISLDPEVIAWINSAKVSKPPAFNAYQCERRRGHIIVTVDMHPGVTPAFMGCKYSHCPGTSKSMFYPTGPMPDVLKSCPLWVWYRPSVRELMDKSQTEVEYINKGGLFLRRCPQTVDQFMEEWNAHH
jgi:hypothetical protein